MTEPIPTAAPAPAPRRGRPTLAKVLSALALLAIAGALIWNYYGYKIWDEFKVMRSEVRASEDSTPVGYVGLNYRRTYNDRPLAFVTEKDGKKLLFAAKREDGTVDHYDITEADPALDVNCLEGGFGRDSIPGIDYPVVEAPGSPKGYTLRDRQPVFGVALGGEARAYPKDLLEKIEVVNDRPGGTPVAAVYDRGRGAALVYDRTLRDGVVTFGTTGYSCKNQPLLYDRKTNGLWLPRGDDLACLSGPHKGELLQPIARPVTTSWSDWLGRNRKTTVIVGNDRAKAIPTE
jgi:hypothetical protein